MEAKILRSIALKANVSIEFKDEKILPGTAWLGGMPIDIDIAQGVLRLNSVGCFEGDYNRMSKGEWRGKGHFRGLIPYIKQTLTEFNLPQNLYLLPLSPVWKKHYDLRGSDRDIKGCPYMIVL